MGDKTMAERVGILETRADHTDEKMDEIIEARKSRSGREWTLIMSVVSVLVAFIANKLGLIG